MTRLLLPVADVDRAATKAIARHAPPAIGRLSRQLAWAADARVLLGLGLFRRFAAAHPDQRRSADRFLVMVATATILHHAVKAVVDQTRPDRTALNPASDPASRTGSGSDAFPSGHAMHAGAVASFFSQLMPAYRREIWTAAGCVAAARVVILAHWPSGVVAGFVSGVVVERLLRRWPRR